LSALGSQGLDIEQVVDQWFHFSRFVMVCESCAKSLTRLAAPDPTSRAAATSSLGGVGAQRRLAQNKLASRNARANPYASACKACGLKTQQHNAKYCSSCAYTKGLCPVCGKQVLDTSSYVMRGGNHSSHAVRARDEANFKSAQQIARDAAREDLLQHIKATGGVGKMPTRAALDKAGKADLAKRLIESYGGLHAAADALSLSKRSLDVEAEKHGAAKRQTARGGCEPPLGDASAGDAAAGGAAAAQHGLESATSPAAPDVTRDNNAASSSAWQLDAASGLYYQLSTEAYYDSRTQLYGVDGKWRKEPPG
jgi:protein-arginine kinase activator protein McsA